MSATGDRKTQIKRVLWTALCLSFAAAAWPAQKNGKPQDCTPRQLASVDVVLGEQILVPADFNQRTVWMVLSLGETFSLLSPHAMETLHIPVEKLSQQAGFYIMKVDGEPVTATGTVDSLRIGQYRLARRDFFVRPKEHPIDTAPERIVLGSLGIGDLWPVDFELDLAHRHFNLYSPDHCPKPVASLWEHYSAIPVELGSLGNVYFPLEVDGIKIVAGISTIDPQTYMGLDVSRQVFGFDEHSPGVEVRSDANGRADVYFRSMTLASGELRLPNVAVRRRLAQHQGLEI
jgi:hypothetical protein